MKILIIIIIIIIDVNYFKLIIRTIKITYKQRIHVNEYRKWFTIDQIYLIYITDCQEKFGENNSNEYVLLQQHNPTSKTVCPKDGTGLKALLVFGYISTWTKSNQQNPSHYFRIINMSVELHRLWIVPICLMIRPLEKGAKNMSNQQWWRNVVDMVTVQLPNIIQCHILQQ